MLNASAPPPVAIVGTGPGDPELLTLRAFRLLSAADVVLFDRLVSPEILALCPAHARKIDVGKVPGGKATSQDVINALLVKEGRSGQRVVRLKGGDPFIFGRGGEEAVYLREHGVDCEVVPGLSSALSVPAAAHIPLTYRGLARHFSVVTGMAAGEDDLEDTWEELARTGGTLVVLMGVGQLESIVERVLAAGRDPKTPAALIRYGTTPEQEVVEAPLCELVAEVRRRGVGSPATLVIGAVVGLRSAIAPAWSVDDTEASTA
ncbi:MAG: uroporphyrinogen-III C-methyltransferase [Bradymonadaceae bacterium]